MAKNDTATLTTGTVKKWFYDKGYGFLTTSDHREVFAHCSQLDDRCEEPKKGDVVNFQVATGKDGRDYARNIVIVKENESV
jgi:cold shock CspA family protein